MPAVSSLTDSADASGRPPGAARVARFADAAELAAEVGRIRVHVYRNLNQPGRCYSVRNAATGRVVALAERVALVDVTFRVQPAGVARVRREGRKNVHAYLVGVLVAPGDLRRSSGRSGDGSSGGVPAAGSLGRRVFYDPYTVQEFTDTESRRGVLRAEAAWLGEDGVRYRPVPG